MVERGRRLFGPVAGFLAAAAWFPFAVMGLPSAASAAAGRVTLMSAGVPRTAILVQHRRLKQARRPAIIVLRGARERGSRLRRSFPLEDLAHASGAVLVYPDPLSGRWTSTAGPEASRDSVFIHDLIASLVGRGIADRGRIFLVGTSGGGIMALRLACEDKNVFAGVAVLAASLPSELEPSCKPAHPVPLMMIAGTADPVVPYHGSVEAASSGKTALVPVERTLGLFGKAAGCSGDITTTAFPDRDTHDGTRAYLDRLNNCRVPVEAVRIEGGGHTPPGLASEPGTGRGPVNGDVNSARLVWDFFRPLGG